MRRERMTRFGVCVLLLAAVALTGCRIAEHGRRAAIDAFASFVLDSVFQMQKAAPLTQAAPKVAPKPVVECAGQIAAPAPAAQPAHSTVVPLRLPVPQPRIASIDLAPAQLGLCRIRIDAARARVEARMAVAELRGVQDVRVRRIIVITPDPAAL